MVGIGPSHLGLVAHLPSPQHVDSAPATVDVTSTHPPTTALTDSRRIPYFHITHSCCVNTMAKIPFGTDKWEPLFKEHALKGEVLDNGAGLASKTVGGTDWWRTTERHSMEGPTTGFWHEVGEGFEISVEIEVKPKVQ